MTDHNKTVKKGANNIHTPIKSMIRIAPKTILCIFSEGCIISGIALFSKFPPYM
jgi:hypothetical protein